MNTPVPPPRRLRPAALPLAVAAGLLVAAGVWGQQAPHASPPQKADPTLDEMLARKAPVLLEHLRARGYKSVGVLNFQVYNGDKPVSLVRLSRRLAERLEVALALAMKDESIRLLRAAGDTASSTFERPLPDHLDPRAIGTFFKIQNYKPYWGSAEEQENGMPADALLTGESRLDRTAKALRVTVRCFGRKEKLTPVCSFAARWADPTVLSEAGVSFAVPRGLTKPKPQEDLGIDEIRTPFATALTRWNDSPVAVEIFYGGKPVRFDDKEEMLSVEAPKPGEKVAIRLRHRKDDNYIYGVVVRVNGENTIDPERTDPLPLNNRKWILLPGKTATIDGFQIDARRSKEFEVRPLPDPNSPEVRYSNRVGTIEVFVFRGEVKETPPKSRPPVGGDSPVISRGGLARGEDVPNTLKALQAELRRQVRKAGAGRGREVLIDKGAAKETQVKLVYFEAAPQEPIAGLTVRYARWADQGAK